MTNPNPFESQDAYSTLRRRWYNRYWKVQSDVDNRVKAILKAAAESTSDKVESLHNKTTFSSKTRIAQLNLSLKEIQSELKDVFNDFTPILRRGSQESAASAVLAQADTDKRYLKAAFSETGLVNNYLKIERNSAQANVQAAIASLTKSNVPLSRRVYKANALANHLVKKDVVIGIMRGDSAREIAQTVKRHINPDVPGGVSYAALRLSRTEINNAFHATSVAIAQDRPWVESMAWNLSSVHEWVGTRTRPVEICERYAAQTHDVNNVPAKPHPMCRCFVTPIVESFETFMTHLTAGQYREWIEDAA